LVASLASAESTGVEAKVQLVAVRTPTSTSIADRLPNAAKSFAVSEEFFVEAWIRRPATSSAEGPGLASVYLDMAFGPKVVAVRSVTPGDSFPLFDNEWAIADEGRVSAIGGCTSLAHTTLGLDGRWVRVATLTMRAIAPGASSVSATPSDAIHGITLVGQFANLDRSRVVFTPANVRVGKARPLGRESQGR